MADACRDLGGKGGCHSVTRQPSPFEAAAKRTWLLRGAGSSHALKARCLMVSMVLFSEYHPFWPLFPLHQSPPSLGSKPLPQQALLDVARPRAPGPEQASVAASGESCRPGATVEGCWLIPDTRRNWPREFASHTWTTCFFFGAGGPQGGGLGLGASSQDPWPLCQRR